MKRKTNLFYTTGPDSKFLTFSNYAESMTGNFLSVNTKLFPSRFLCLYINNLNSTTKPEFIKFLVAYYENKLAILRDTVNNIENKLSPISYLFEALNKVLIYDEESNSYKISLDEAGNLIYNETSSSIFDDNFNMYVSDITEQDYNGIYTDIICTLDLLSLHNCKIIKNNTSSEIESLTIEDNNIYGWDNINNIPGYESIYPVYDYSTSFVKKYYIDSNIDSLLLSKLPIQSDSIKFNIIIPLYEVVNIDVDDNDTILGYDDEDTDNYIINLNNSNKYRHNVPLGIWMNADKEEDNPIEISRDLDTGLSGSWSLLISTQFKPFPYSTKYSNDTESSDKGVNFATFTQVLSRMNNILDKFEESNKRISSLENRLQEIQTVINNLGTNKSIDNVKKTIASFENDIKTEISEFKEEVKETLDNIKWKYQ